jgi:hypothetical protein
MRLKYRIVLYLAGLLLISGCAPRVDWKTRYSEYVGGTIVKIDTTVPEEAFLDETEHGSLTRATWAKLDNGRFLFLGLPTHGLDPQTTVERTVILNQQEFTEACAQAFGDQGIEGWRFPHSHRGNSLRIYLNGRNQDYCEFFYLPNGWELRTVQSQGVIKSALP